MTPQRIRWFRVERWRSANRPETIYDGPDENQARSAMNAAGKTAAVHMEFHWSYPPPERCDACECKNSPARQTLCPFGHATECHYPQKCVQAECRHLVEFGQVVDHPSLLATTESDRMAAWLAQGVHQDDKVFAGSPTSGDPACLCSRCDAVIAENPVRLFDGACKTERRYHPKCLGIPEREHGEEKGGR
jgi:hypothetical protein